MKGLFITLYNQKTITCEYQTQFIYFKLYVMPT